MKHFNKFITSIFVFTSISLISACNCSLLRDASKTIESSTSSDANEDSSGITTSITFDYGIIDSNKVYDNYVASTNVNRDNTFTIPSVKEKYQSYFDGWYIKNTDTKLEAGTVVNSNTEVEARWIELIPGSYVNNKLTLTWDEIVEKYPVAFEEGIIKGDTDSSENASYMTDLEGTVIVDKSITRIRPHAFSHLSELEKVIIPSTTTTIDNAAFAYCNKLTSIEVSSANSKYTTVDGVLFKKDMTTLYSYPAGKAGTSYSIPNTVATIAGSAFAGNQNLETVTITQNVNNQRTTIGGAAFMDSKELTTVVISNYLNPLGDMAFKNCTKLASIDLSTSRLTEIGKQAFLGDSSLTSVSLPSTLTTIKELAFSDCTNLESIVIPNSVTKIESYTFSGCTKLSSVTLSNNITMLYISVFSRCRSLTSITIPNGVTTIHTLAFSGDTGLTSITLPSSVTTVNDKAFSACTNLKTLKLEHTNISNISFVNDELIESVNKVYLKDTSSNASTIMSSYGLTKVTSDLAGYDMYTK